MFKHILQTFVEFPDVAKCFWLVSPKSERTFMAKVIFRRNLQEISL